MDFRVAVNGPAAGNLFFCQGIHPCAFRQVNVALRATLLIDGGEEYVAAEEILILDLIAFFIGPSTRTSASSWSPSSP